LNRHIGCIETNLMIVIGVLLMVMRNIDFLYFRLQ
jgi:hypothetical protein